MAYFDLQQSPVGQPQPAAAPGKASITAYNGATFELATEENRYRFLADPEAYVPRYDGRICGGS